jgi:hypothetical protein
MQSGPSLSPSLKWRSKLSPSCSDAGTKPLAVVQTLSAVADLKSGLTLKVKHALEPFTGFWMGLRKTLDVGWLSPAAEEVLKKIASQLQSRTQLAVEDSPPTPWKQTGLPSNSPHLPRV